MATRSNDRSPAATAARQRGSDATQLARAWSSMLMISLSILLLTLSVLAVRFGSDRFPGSSAD